MTTRMNAWDAGDEAVKNYLDGIGTYDLLTAEEEVILAKAIERGRKAEVALAAGTAKDVAEEEAAVDAGLAARRRFIQANLRLVVSIAKRYQRSGLPFLDLVPSNITLVGAEIEMIDVLERERILRRARPLRADVCLISQRRHNQPL